jgi:hypothetical protein
MTLVSKDLPMYVVLNEAKNRGVKLRYITEITEENISYCKELMKYVVELRHLDGIKGNFGIGDRSDFRASASIIEGEPPTELIVSTVRSFVEQQRYFFDMLWSKAIPAKQRIKEIEEGLKRNFIETIQHPAETEKLLAHLLASANEEILIIFSSVNTILRYEREGLLQLLKNANSERSVKIRILVERASLTNEMAQRLLKEQCPQIEIQYLDKSLKTKVTTLIIDNEFSLVIELKDDSKESSSEAMGLVTYSNSESTVLSYVSIFESLWMQAELSGGKKTLEN